MNPMGAPISIRLRAASPGLLALPWLDPLGTWPEDAADFRDLNVGPSRHLVRFVEADYVLYALKELPTRTADKEYRVLRDLEVRELPAVRPVGLVDQPDTGNSILVTEYLEHSWQFRRLFRRLPRELVKHRERLLDAIAGLLVDLHREGVFWGDCSLANTLFKRDGQLLQAFLVDAETSEVHAALSNGQRAHDLDILVENVSGDLVDVSMELGESGERIDEDLAAAESIADRYRALWEELTHTETFGTGERYKVEARVRRLNELGFAIDELALEPATEDRSTLRLKVAVANRRFHAQELRRLTGLEVGEGQAAILLNDLRAYQARLGVERPEAAASDVVAGVRWRTDVFEPGMARAAAALGDVADPIQAYCDLLEVRWLLSEGQGHDVGQDAALAALAARQAPSESAAQMVVAETATASFPDRGLRGPRCRRSGSAAGSGRWTRPPGPPGPGERPDLDDSGPRQADDLGADQRRPQPRVGAAEPVGDLAEDLLGDELAQHGRGVLVADGRADQRQQRALVGGVVPDRQEQLDHPLARLARVLGQDGHQLLDRVHRELDGGHEQGLLGAEVVVDQGRVDAGQVGHPADGGVLVAVLGEGAPGGVKDRLPGPRDPGPPAGPCHRFALPELSNR
jgi:tRNA A-37 threonylcarbamoyl transferase component Bud32